MFGSHRDCVKHLIKDHGIVEEKAVEYVTNMQLASSTSCTPTASTSPVTAYSSGGGAHSSNSTSVVVVASPCSSVVAVTGGGGGGSNRATALDMESNNSQYMSAESDVMTSGRSTPVNSNSNQIFPTQRNVRDYEKQWSAFLEPEVSFWYSLNSVHRHRSLFYVFYECAADVLLPVVASR